LRYADYPLTYDFNTFQPALSTILYDREYLDWQRAYLDQAYPDSYKLIEANFYGMGREMFLAPLLDVFSSEGVPHDGGWQIGWHDDTGNYAWGYENYILKRFYGQNKAIRYYRFVNTFGGENLDCSRQTLEGTMKYLAFYGIYLSNGCLMQSSPENPEQKVFERDRDLYQKYVVQMEKPLVRLGWQPLTLAEIDDPSLYLERWGGRPGQDLAFSLRNENPAASPYTLDIPFRDFGISDLPPTFSVRELTSGQEVAFAIVFGKTMPQTGMVKDVIEVSGVLAPEDTVAYYLTTSLLSQTPTAPATPTPTATLTATPTPTATSSPTPTVTSTPTSPASQCVGDANANGIGDVVDVMTTASESGCRAYLPLVVANWRQPWPTPTPSPTQACEYGATPTPQQTLSKLAMVEANEYWIAYESPTQYALSLAWAGDSLWMADLFKGVFYKVQEGADGLTIIETVKVHRDPFMQARDLTWDGHNLWSVHWGDLIRHDMTDPNLGADLWINEGNIGAPHLHHLKAIAWDGEFIWSALDGTLNKHNKTDFEVAETFQVPGTFSPAGMAFHGGDLWVANRSVGFIDRLDSNSFALLSRYSMVQQPFGLAWSDSNLWVYDWYTNRIYKILKLPATSLDPEDDYLTTENYTQPESIIRGEVTWTRAGSPYVVSDLVIEKGATLTIEPGVTVYVRGEGPISVQGVLQAMGTPDLEIVFTHESPNQVWGGLYFSGEEANAS
ncbi:MAG: hypothetical protein ACE5F6_20560, partial [Anaerolineae bacterium]